MKYLNANFPCFNSILNSLSNKGPNLTLPYVVLNKNKPREFKICFQLYMLFIFIIDFMGGELNRYKNPLEYNRVCIIIISWYVKPFLYLVPYSSYEGLRICDRYTNQLLLHICPLCVRFTREIRQGTLTIKARRCFLS